MSKKFYILLILAMALALASCAPAQAPAPEEAAAPEETTAEESAAEELAESMEKVTLTIESWRNDDLGTFFHRTFFGFQLQLGNQTMGATVAAMMFLIILLGVLLYLFGWQRRVTTYEI